MDDQVSIPFSILYEYPNIQWILIGALGLSIIFQFLFYIYFFCSFKRNYSRNLTLKSYRKQKLDIKGNQDADSFTDEEDAGVFTSDDHTIDLPQRNINPKVEARSRRIASQNNTDTNLFQSENKRKIIHETQLKSFKFNEEESDESPERVKSTPKQKGFHKNPPPFHHTDSTRPILNKTKPKLPSRPMPKNDIKIENLDMDDNAIKNSQQESRVIKLTGRNDIDTQTIETSIEFEAERSEKLEAKRELPRNLEIRRNPRRPKPEPAFTILNEKRDSSRPQADVKKNRSGRMHKMQQQVPLQTEAPSKRHIRQRNLSPEMDLYEVYFDKNGATKNDKQNQNGKTNIQKIKFKRRSPSIESA